MKLVAFRVRNYRSIIDTDWQHLSPDDLTTVVGQNESGKSAILDALLAFHTPKIEDDSLRNDGTYPKVSCRFKTSRGEIKEIFGDKEAPKGVYAALERSGYEIEVTRAWSSLEDIPHVLDLESEELRTLLQSHEIDSQAKYRAVLEARVNAAKDTSQEEPITATEPSDPNAVAITTVEETVTSPEPVEAATPVENNEEEETEEEPIPEPNILGYDGFIDGIMDKKPEFIKFVDEASFLPETIDLDDIVKKNTAAKGYVGTKNFLALAGLTVDDILINSHRRSGGKIRTASRKITAEFHDFWRQVIGGNEAKAQIEVELKHYPHSHNRKTYVGKPYLVFWVKNGEELLHPSQRSKGLQWFLSFFLQLRAAGLDDSNQVLLMDEPGHYLHIEAQKDVLKVLEDSKKSLQIVYTTHSPNLIELNGLHRILAVQRSDSGDSGETQVLSARKLVQAKRDTLLPVLSVIGADISTQNVIEKNNNIILEEVSAYYYLSSFKRLLSNDHPMHFLPANGAANVPIYVKLFLGWGIDYVAVLDDDRMGREQLKRIQDEVYGEANDESRRHLMALTGFNGIEDIFTKGDFRSLVLQEPHVRYKDRSESNSEYAKRMGLSKPLLSIGFYHRVNDGTISLSDLSDQTQDNVKHIIQEITDKLSEIEVYSGSATIS